MYLKSLINRLRKRFYCIDPTRQSLKAVFHYFRIHPSCQSVWPDGWIIFFNIWPFARKKNCHNSISKVGKIRFKSMPNTNLPTKKCPRLIFFSKRGGISPNLVALHPTRIPLLRSSQSSILFFYKKMGHSRPVFLYFHLFNTQLTENKCSIYE